MTSLDLPLEFPYVTSNSRNKDTDHNINDADLRKITRMKNQSFVTLFIDDDPRPVGDFPAPVEFELDTRRLVDGDHVLKVVSRDASGKEGLKVIPFTVRNGPAVAIEGLNSGEVVDGVLPLMINAYGKGDQKTFTLHGSETPHSIPWWVLAGIIAFAAWAVYFVYTSMEIKL